MTIHAVHRTHCMRNFNASARMKSVKSECSGGQPDIPTRFRLSQNAGQMGDLADGVLFGDLSKNKTRPTRKNWASIARVVIIHRSVRFVTVSEHHRGCNTMQRGRLGSLGLGTFQTLSDRLRNDLANRYSMAGICFYFPESGSGSVNTDRPGS